MNKALIISSVLILFSIADAFGAMKPLKLKKAATAVTDTRSIEALEFVGFEESSEPWQPVRANLKLNSTDVLHFVKRFLPKNPVVLEAGAFDGADTSKMAHLWRKGIIHSFEPVPQNYELLKRATEMASNVRTYQLALSDSNGTADFNISEYKEMPGVPTASGSLLKPQEHLKYDNRVVFPKTITVPTVTLDSWAKEHNVSKIDFMWLDLQGHELTVLKHARRILRNVKLIFMEVEFVKAYKDQPLYSEIKDWLEKEGFRVLALDFDEKYAALGDMIPADNRYFGNVVFINMREK